MDLNRIFILLASGTICIYSFDQETGILEKLLRPDHIKDSDGKSITQTITTMNFVNVVPPKYDCEVLQDYNTKPEDDYIATDGKMLLLGFNKGTFAFIHVGKNESDAILPNRNTAEKVYARFSIHRQSIEKIVQTNKDGVFMSLCRELILNIWGFNSETIVIYQTLKVFRLIKEVSFTDNMLMSFETRDAELFCIENNSDHVPTLKIYNKEKVNDHNGRVN